MATRWSDTSSILSSILDACHETRRESTSPSQHSSIRVSYRVSDGQLVIVVVWRSSLEWRKTTSNSIWRRSTKLMSWTWQPWSSKVRPISIWTQGPILLLSRQGKSSSSYCRDHRSWSRSKVRLRLPGKGRSSRTLRRDVVWSSRKMKTSNIPTYGVVECRSMRCSKMRNEWWRWAMNWKHRRCIDQDYPIGSAR